MQPQRQQLSGNEQPSTTETSQLSSSRVISSTITSSAIANTPELVQLLASFRNVSLPSPYQAIDVYFNLYNDILQIRNVIFEEVRNISQSSEASCSESKASNSSLSKLCLLVESLSTTLLLGVLWPWSRMSFCRQVSEMVFTLPATDWRHQGWRCEKGSTRNISSSPLLQRQHVRR